MGKEKITPKPIILHEGSFGSADLNTMRKLKTWRLLDIYEDQLGELFEINHPEFLHSPDFKSQRFRFVQDRQKAGGSWIYLPWNGCMIHTVSAQDFFTLVTNRNKNLITEEEQYVLQATAIGVLGMSVGNGIAVALAYSGIGSTIKIADFDKLETCNLNRLRSGIHHIGDPKVSIAAQQIYEANPYLEIEQFPEGVKEAETDQFFGGKTRLNLIIDEIDDFKVKINLRLEARKRRIPVLMFTSLGDNILIDVERYDLNSELELFNGLIGDIPEEILRQKEITPADINRYAIKLVGLEYIPTRALLSLPEIGKTLVGRPQLYSTVTVDGGLAAYVTRMILLGKPLKSGRYFVKFADLVNMPTDDFSGEGRKSLIEKIQND